MKFLKFVVDFENQTDVWEPHAGDSLSDFLSSTFQLPPSLQTPILALTLSLDLPTRTTVRYALPRISRHLTSIGVFGPGFGAVIPKWGGGSEISQVACRAQAVGGGVYVLGTDFEDKEPCLTDGLFELKATNDVLEGKPIRAKHLVTSGQWGRTASQSVGLAIVKTITIVSSDFTSLFTNTVEGGPTAAVSVIVFPSNSLVVDGKPQAYPVYIMAHSNETGECPAGQCKLDTFFLLFQALRDDPNL
jgi:RAB protein geranylgeranyltransferase component A